MPLTSTLPYILLLFVLLLPEYATSQIAPITPQDITFVRQSVQRFVFDESLQIPLASLSPKGVIGLSAMHPQYHFLDQQASVQIENNLLAIHSERPTQTSIWFGGFNPFATYSINFSDLSGEGEVGFEFASQDKSTRFLVTIQFRNQNVLDVRQRITIDSNLISDSSIATNLEKTTNLDNSTLILQMLGSGLTVYLRDNGLPKAIAQSEFASTIDLRSTSIIQNFQTSLFTGLQYGTLIIEQASSVLSSGIGLADIRAITYEDGSPLLDQGRLWYTMTIRGRGLPHPLQGVFSLNPTVFDIKFEGVILFDRNDGILRNEVASHLFFDRNEQIWRGVTTGFSAYAKKDEHKQLLAIESKKDPRFGFSVMKASPFGMVGDIEDPHILYDDEAGKWRMLTCKNYDGYKAIMMESDSWNSGYIQIAGPVSHNSTGTSIQKIGDTLYGFSGSQDRKIYTYSYPDLKETGILKMDLPPWDAESGTRVWPNVVQLPEGYPFQFVALMMDRFNYPRIEGPQWTYGALYLYYGFVE